MDGRYKNEVDGTLERFSVRGWSIACVWWGRPFGPRSAL